MKKIREWINCIKISYIQKFKIYNTMINIIIILLGNISITPQIVNIELAGFWPCDWDIISSIKEFTVRLYKSVFTNIIQDLPTLVENLLNDMSRRIRIYSSIIGGPIDNQALRHIIHYTLDGHATDNLYWQAYFDVPPQLKVALCNILYSLSYTSGL